MSRRRPRKPYGRRDRKRLADVNLRLYDDELAQLDACASALGVTRSDFARAALGQLANATVTALAAAAEPIAPADLRAQVLIVPSATTERR